MMMPLPSVSAAAPAAIVVMGVSASGKTALARDLGQQLGIRFMDADDFHSQDAKAQMASGIPLTDAQRLPWVDRLGQAMREQVLDQGQSCTLAFSGLRAEHRQRLRDCGVPLRFLYLHVSPKEIARRLHKRRNHFMPASLADSQFQALQLPEGEADVRWLDAEGPATEVLQQALAALAADPNH